MNFKKITAGALAVLTIGIGAAGCGKKEAEEETQKTEILTNIYKGTLCPLPDGYNVNSQAAPVYDAASGTVL